MYNVSFPGLGIDWFHMDKTAFSIFGHGIAWYGILITCGMVLAVLLAMRLIRYEKISSDDILDLAFTVIVFGVIGARIYYVVFSWGDVSYVVSDGSVWHNIWGTVYNCIAIWEGGLAIYGGVLGGLLSAFVFSKIKKVSFLKLTDILAPCVLVGQIIGRWGNFVNVEAYGSETDLPWRMGIQYVSGGEVISEKFVHPTFLYESLWNLVLLVVILSIYKKKKFDGQMSAMYFIVYGIGRMLIEGLRTDSLMLGNLRVSQGLSFLLVILGIMMFVILGDRSRKKREETLEYASVYAGGSDNTEEDEGDKTDKAEETDKTEKDKNENGEERNDGTHN